MAYNLPLRAFEVMRRTVYCTRLLNMKSHESLQSTDAGTEKSKIVIAHLLQGRWYQ